MVGARSVHIDALSASPYIACAYDNADLRTYVNTFFYHPADFINKIVIEDAVRACGKRFPRKLDEHPFVAWFHEFFLLRI